jgi:hypothetical protein
LAACGRAENGTPAREQAPSGLSLQVVGTRPAFGATTQVDLALTNASRSTIVLSHLNERNRAEVVDVRGTPMPIHELSVGVAKSIAVAPESSARVPLLFACPASSARILRFYGKEYALP